MKPHIPQIYHVLILLVFLTACSGTRSDNPPLTMPPPAASPAEQLPDPTQDTSSALPTNTPAGEPSQGPDPGISLGEDQLIPPIPPPNIKTEVAAGSVTLSWQGTGSDIDANYIVYRRLAGTDDWEFVASIPIEGNNRGTYAYQDTTIEGGNVYEYAITTKDKYKNESALSEIVTAESK